MTRMQPTRQIAALPYRFDPAGNVEVLLITSRSDRYHWLPPKGQPIEGRASRETAAQEAFEEAGIIGEVAAKPLGEYATVKSRSNGTSHPLAVTIFPMHVERCVQDWPEKGQRVILWFEPTDAAKVVREPELAAMIEQFRPEQLGPLNEQAEGN